MLRGSNAMSKKLLFESSKDQFLQAAHEVCKTHQKNPSSKWSEFVNSLHFSFDAISSVVTIAWEHPSKSEVSFSLKETEIKFYYQGDSVAKTKQQQAQGMIFGKSDPIEEQNKKLFLQLAEKVVNQAGIFTEEGNDDERYQNEELFHDNWAECTDVSKIDVMLINEACTAPEMRYIRKVLGNDLKNKQLLDVGCGLGEASVYFALEGSQVTAMDISKKMLESTATLAEHYQVSVKTHKSTAETLNFSQTNTFDIIYVGNLFHHVDIDETLKKIVRQMKPEGVLVSWDPLAYNPIINIYRKMATQVRTSDEHPLTISDLRLFKKYFNDVEYKYFWFTTLIIFVAMWLIQRRNPNKERFWKKIIEEADKWRWLYLPLEKIDTLLLTIFPFLRPLCWNVVIVAKNPIEIQE